MDATRWAEVIRKGQRHIVAKELGFMADEALCGETPPSGQWRLATTTTLEPECEVCGKEYDRADMVRQRS